MHLTPELLDSIIAAFEDPVFILDGAGTCIAANRGFASFVGRDRKELRGRAITLVWPNFDLCTLSAGEVSQEFLIGNAQVPVRLILSSVPEGMLVCRVISASRDGASLASFHSQRLETLGMLAGGVAHDFNNILTGILGHITYLKTVLPGAGVHTESLTAIEEGARKASVMTQQILNFSRLDTKQAPSEIDLTELAQRTCTLLRGALPPSCQLRTLLPNTPVRVLAVEGKIAQVMVNLVVNARDAVEGDSVIEVSLGRKFIDGSKTCIGPIPVALKGEYAIVRVIDKGSGMPDDVLEHAFEPYFTTKGDTGTGLGLATVAAIVREFGGGIDVHSAEGEGTTIEVYLPLSMAAVHEQRQEAVGASHGLQGGTERILVIDDESPVRNVLSLSLEHLGYEVHTAGSGVEGIRMFREAERAIDLVLLDMLMPHLSGDEVFERLKEIDPQVRVVIISGFSSEDAVRRVLAAGGKAFVQKPFTIDELAVTVRECLDE